MKTLFRKSIFFCLAAVLVFSACDSDQSAKHNLRNSRLLFRKIFFRFVLYSKEFKLMGNNLDIEVDSVGNIVFRVVLMHYQ